MNNSNPPATPPSSTAPDSKRRRNSWIVWIWFWMTLGLVAIVQIPNEIVAWQYAAALEARETGDKARGYELLEAAIAHNIDRESYEQLKVHWLTEDERYAEAVEFLDSKGPRTLLAERVELLLHLRRFPEAIKINEKIRDESKATGKPKPLHARNHLAYSRALGKTDLAEAAADMDAVVKTTSAELEFAIAELKSGQLWPWTADKTAKTAAEMKRLLPAVLDTRGFVRYQMDQAELAEGDLNEAVKLFEQEVKELLEDKSKMMKMKRNARDVEKYLKENQHVLGVLIYHRGLNRQKLGREAEAKQDFKRVRELIGKEPDDSLF